MALHDGTVESSQGLPCRLFFLQYANDPTADYSMLRDCIFKEAAYGSSAIPLQPAGPGEQAQP